jgi:hypothetical protein
MQNEIEIVKAVRELAESKYNEGHGWQVIVECMDDKEIMEHLKFMQENASLGEITVESAIKEFTEFAEIHTERHDEVRATIW